MIVNASFKNFYSFADEAEISFEVGKKPSASLYDINLTDDRRLNKVVAVLGANGSGKTQFIKPLAFLGWFVSQSFLSSGPDSGIPSSAHLFNQDSPTEFEIQFLMKGQEYKYRLHIHDDRVIHESMHVKSSRSYSYLFSRDWLEGGYDYKQKGFGFNASQAKQIRGNTSLIAAAYNYDVPAAADFVHYFSFITSNVKVSGRHDIDTNAVVESAEFFYKNKEFQSSMIELMCQFDLGISDIQIKEASGQDELGNAKTYYLPYGIHKEGLQAFEMPFIEESSGTKSSFVLLRRLLPILKHGGTICLDEIDNDLHPHMLPLILDLFKQDETNPFESQIIFTCHTAEMINHLRKHQIYLVEKDKQVSDAWRLDDVQGLRADDNLYAKYMAGALSAVPSL